MTRLRQASEILHRHNFTGALDRVFAVPLSLTAPKQHRVKQTRIDITGRIMYSTSTILKIAPQGLIVQRIATVSDKSLPAEGTYNTRAGARTIEY